MLAGLFQQSCRLKGLKPLNFRHQKTFDAYSTARGAMCALLWRREISSDELKWNSRVALYSTEGRARLSSAVA
jgi:hypothetical protein